MSTHRTTTPIPQAYYAPSIDDLLKQVRAALATEHITTLATIARIEAVIQTLDDDDDNQLPKGSAPPQPEAVVIMTQEAEKILKATHDQLRMVIVACKYQNALVEAILAVGSQCHRTHKIEDLVALDGLRARMEKNRATLTALTGQLLSMYDLSLCEWIWGEEGGGGGG
ncbi:uncharacterized protein BP01DRAFT_386947 [Aspergillus saccharolyticus JOP 1030-1]|uniref:Uncharacterized protein n=1 Tax=Aspergillus saccharolyticus JOP 1030-1 TaxID=1450539 RepID=A0A318ZBJ3_9EURO|nr:hypothetical protein BP01DRAFT_386947 [Aspergillus saccharolyticus JOP 1030-1]PYH40840.1 hypothetical protein BP01DRAFT_386947 [Aspergillus saccharolyticus JOP 1030-1]